MTLSEEIDKIFANRINPLDGQMNLNDAEQEQFQSEILELFERKLNEVVPEYPLSVCVSVAEVRIRRDVITDMQQNIKKVLEGV